MGKISPGFQKFIFGGSANKIFAGIFLNRLKRGEKMSKAQGISINVIIVAAIALLVLVVLSVIFMGRIGQFGSKVGECKNKGGKCADIGESCGQVDSSVEDYPTTFSDWKCPLVDDQEVDCCVKITA